MVGLMLPAMLLVGELLHLGIRDPDGGLVLLLSSWWLLGPSGLGTIGTLSTSPLL